MSRQNKVNPGRYKTAGRLTPDELGRELRRQNGAVPSEHDPTARPAWETTPPATTAAVKRAKKTVAAAHAGPIERTVIGAARAAGRAASVLDRVAATVTPARLRRSGSAAPKVASSNRGAAAKSSPRSATAVRRTVKSATAAKRR